MLSLKKHFASTTDTKIIDILLLPQSWDLLIQRLAKRGTDNSASIRTRLGNAHLDLEHAADYTYVVINDTLEQCLAHCEQILYNESALTPQKTPHLFEHQHAQTLLKTPLIIPPSL